MIHLNNFDPNFEFLEINELTDRELCLKVRKKAPANEAKGYVPAYIFDIHLDGVNEPIGYIDIRIGNVPNLVYYGGHIGYGINEKWQKNGYATRSCKLIFQVALKHGLEIIWITCRPDNIASARVCEKAGGEYVGMKELPPDHEMRSEPGRTHSKRYKFDLHKILNNPIGIK